MPEAMCHPAAMAVNECELDAVDGVADEWAADGAADGDDPRGAADGTDVDGATEGQTK
jgi:hypothetical protein